MVLTTFTPRQVDWQTLRDAFVRRPERATYAELAAEFGVNESRIKRCASDEGWVSLRAAYLEKQLRACNAGEIVLAAVKVDGAIVHGFADMALIVTQQLKEIVTSINPERSPQGRADTLNTCTFAQCNLARALKEVGVVGIPKGLADGAQKENGRWNSAMLAQINLTIQNLQPIKPVPDAQQTG